ncbi:S8 family serine peptidase, partial [Romboutsia sp.]|uniref:S8 family serine peptidase n=1 Tax=Romboutsia sp. TaxID=1965302 RepID=UPI003F38B660
MHNKKWSNNVKKTLTVVMVGAMMLPNIGHALSPNEYFEKNSTDFTKIELNKDLKAERVKIQEGINTNSEELISVIVEFNTAPLVYSKKSSPNMSQDQKVKLEKIKKEHKKFKDLVGNKQKANQFSTAPIINHEYTNTFNGASIQIKGTEIEKLAESDVIKAIWKDETVKLELPKETKSSEITPFMSSSKPLIGVDKLHSEGIKGKGIKVGVIDTGIDYNHPDLKDNYKGEVKTGASIDVSKGWDFVDNDADPMETTYKDWQGSGHPEFNPETGSEYYTSHGTHVSGTIAGTGENDKSEFATIGVAPEADLYGYRVLGPYGRGSTSDIVAAIEKSVEDGMDVINLSLGANVNDPLYPTAVATNNAMLAGVVTVLANGNAGPAPGTVGTPGTAPLPISVGASTTAIQIAKFKIEASNNISTNGRLLARDFTELPKIQEGEIVFCGLGKEEGDFSNVTGKIALIERGELALNQKVINAKKAGAKAVILFNNVDGEIEHYLGENTEFIPAVSIDKVTGQKLKAALEAQEKITTKISLTEYTQTQPDLLASFSSRGPVNNGDIKPDVVAPGVSIMSTYPEYINHPAEGDDYSQAYSRISGTSMAAPHVAGLSALVLSQNKDYDAFDVKLALMNTGDDLAQKYGVNEMGAGRINAIDAVKSQVVIKNKDASQTVNDNGEIVEVEHETGALSFGTVAISKKDTVIKDKLIIDNKTDKTKTYDVSVEYVTPSETNGAQDAIKNKVKIGVKNNAVANKSKETSLDVSLTIPKDAEAGVYQGYIKLTSRQNNKEVHNIPFSVKYVEPGLAPIQLFTNSATNDLDWVHPWLTPGIGSYIKVNTPVEKIDIVVKDYATDKLIGYRGSLDASMLIPDYTYQLRDALDMLLMVYPIDESGKKSKIPMKLDEGKYKLEFIATDKEGNTTSKSQPFIVDNTPAQTTELSLNGGVHEIDES